MHMKNAKNALENNKNSRQPFFNSAVCSPLRPIRSLYSIPLLNPFSFSLNRATAFLYSSQFSISFLEPVISFFFSIFTFVHLIEFVCVISIYSRSRTFFFLGTRGNKIEETKEENESTGYQTELNGNDILLGLSRIDLIWNSFFYRWWHCFPISSI